MQNASDELAGKKYRVSDSRHIHYGVWILIAGILTIFGCIGLGRFAIGMIIPEMGSALKLNNTQLGIIVSGTFIGYLASTVISGNLAARFGAKQVIAASMFLISAGMVIAGSAYNFLLAVIGQLLIGVGSGGSNVPTMGLITRWYSKKLRGFASGLMTIGSGLGFALAGTIVPYLSLLYGNAGWRASWYLVGALVAVIAILGIVVFKNNPSEIGVEPIGSAQDTPEAPQPGKVVGGTNYAHLKGIYTSKPLWSLGLIYFMFGFSYVVFTTFFAKYLIEELGFSHALMGQIWAFIGVVSILSGFTWGALSDRIGRKRALILVYLLQSFCLLVFAISANSSIIICASILYALTLWSIPSIMSAACADYVGGMFAPAALGMITIFFGIGQVINPWISGYAIDVTHDFAVTFLLSAAASAIGAGLSITLPKHA